MRRRPHVEVREERLVVLLRGDEKERLEIQAEKLGLSLSAYVRAMLLAPGSIQAPVVESR